MTAPWHQFQPAPPPAASFAADSTREVVAKVLVELQAVNRQKQAALLVLYLPTLEELDTTDMTGTWR